MSQVNKVLSHIHDVIQASGLHFMINQTPWSSYITIRRKFLDQRSAAEPTSLGQNVRQVSRDSTGLEQQNDQLIEENRKLRLQNKALDQVKFG